MISKEQIQRGNKTYALDLSRSPFAGVLESGIHTFALLIAIRVFDPVSMFKAMIPASISIGLLASPFVLSIVSRFNLQAIKVASVCWAVSGLLLLLASQLEQFHLFFMALTPAMFCYALTPTFMIFAYSQNYTPNQRGKRISVFFVIASLSSGCFAFACGKYLDANIENYKWVISAIACAAFFSSVCAFFMPSPRVEAKHHVSTIENISLCWKDKLFGWMLLSWMFIGFANLMTIPLRVEYLANTKYGVHASNEEITMVLIVIPSVCRIISTRIWGHLFDKVNLLILRCVLNALFLISIFAFFQSNNLILIGLSMAVMGSAHGGGNIAWNLWVTKIASPEKTGAYMSIHTAFTGVRGLLSPFLGFLAISYYGPSITSWIATGLAFFSILVNLPLINDPRLSAKREPELI